MQDADRKHLLLSVGWHTGRIASFQPAGRHLVTAEFGAKTVCPALLNGEDAT